MLRNHIGWMEQLWSEKQFARLFWLGRDITGRLGDYLVFHAIQALSGQDGIPFNIKADWQTSPNLMAAFHNSGYPDPPPAIPSEDICGICLEGGLELVPIHHGIHKFCQDCLENLVTRAYETNSGNAPAWVVCPLCRLDVSLHCIQETLREVNLRKMAQRSTATIGAPIQEVMDNMLPYASPPPQPQPDSDGWNEHTPLASPEMTEP